MLAGRKLFIATPVAYAASTSLYSTGPPGNPARRMKYQASAVSVVWTVCAEKPTS
jgi:hypothetical protein